jgi:hypothetical protein
LDLRFVDMATMPDNFITNYSSYSEDISLSPLQLLQIRNGHYITMRENCQQELSFLRTNELGTTGRAETRNETDCDDAVVDTEIQRVLDSQDLSAALEFIRQRILELFKTLKRQMQISMDEVTTCTAVSIANYCKRY